MEQPCLKDPDQFPSGDILSQALGDAKKAWDVFINFIAETKSSFTSEWRYYNDGKAWLYKITQKKKTICWVTVFDHLFKTTFYFPDRAEPVIKESDLDQQFIDQFVNGKHYGKTRGLTIPVQKVEDLEATKILIEIKEHLK